LVFDRRAEATRSASALGFGVIEHVRDISADIVILAVPVPALDGCLRALAPHLRAGQLVVDVCSIKEEPARLMRHLLPPCVEILATHPMFGPESAKERVAGSQVVLCPIRGQRWRRLAAFLKRRIQLQIIVTSPEEHDRQAAMTQGLTHLLARAFSLLGEPPRIRTRSFDLIAEAFALVSNDASEVFDAVTLGNRHVGRLCAALSLTLSALGSPTKDGSASDTTARPRICDD
jgi:prephenate dehydrogenase